MANNFLLANLTEDQSYDISEDWNTVTENMDGDKGLSATLTFRCPWIYRDDVVGDLLSAAYPYPRFPTAGARARTASIRPEAVVEVGSPTDGSLTVPEWAIVTVNYAQGKEENEDGTEIISESLEPNAEFITCNHELFRWGSASGDKLTPEEAPGKIIIGFDYVQTRYKLPSIPVEVLTPNICNSGSVTASLLGLTFPAQTLLYVNSLPQRTITTDGTEGWNMTSRFSYRKDGWNKFWRAKTQAFESLYLYGGSTYNPVPTGSFSTVLV